jgi:hypothetical protein
MGKTIYLVDASSFITPYNDYYSLEYVPGFWDGLLREHEKGNIFSINAIRKEVVKIENSLKQWFETPDFPKDFFREEDEKTINFYKKIIAWTKDHPFFSIEEKSRFANGADGLLIAYAKVHEMTVVTEERFFTDPKTRSIKIPNVCVQFKIPCVKVVEMVKSLNVRLVLEGPIRHDLFSASGLSN